MKTFDEFMKEASEEGTVDLLHDRLKSVANSVVIVDETIRGETLEEDGHTHPFNLELMDDGSVKGVAEKGESDHTHNINNKDETTEVQNHTHKLPKF